LALLTNANSADRREWIETSNNGEALTMLILQTVFNIQKWDNPLLLDGIKLNTKAGSDIFPIDALQVYQFDGQKYVPVGKLLDFEGKTEE